MLDTRSRYEVWKESHGYVDPINYLYTRHSLRNEDDGGGDDGNGSKRVTRSSTARTIAKIGQSLLSTFSPSSFRNLRPSTGRSSIFSVLQSMAYHMNDSDSDGSYVFEQYDEDEESGKEDEDNNDDDSEDGEDEEGNGICDDAMAMGSEGEGDSVNGDAADEKDDATGCMRCEDE